PRLTPENPLRLLPFAGSALGKKSKWVLRGQTWLVVTLTVQLRSWCVLMRPPTHSDPSDGIICCMSPSGTTYWVHITRSSTAKNSVVNMAYVGRLNCFGILCWDVSLFLLGGIREMMD